MPILGEQHNERDWRRRLLRTLRRGSWGVLVVHAACHGSDVRCTDAGCGSSVLSVFVLDADGNPTSGWHGTVGIGDVSVNVDCRDATASDDAIHCYEDRFDVDLSSVSTGGTVDVDLETEDGLGVSAEGAEPAWENSFPNGEECPPVCVNGTLDLIAS